MDLLLIIGRALFALLWVGAGFAHFKNLDAMTGYATYKKVPAAKLAVLGSGLTFLVGGILILLGAWIDLAAALIAVTVILAAVLFHQFWRESDAETRMQEQMAFNKDLSLGGAAIILFALVAGGALTDFGPSIGNIAFFG